MSFDPIKVLDHGYVRLVESWGGGLTAQDVAHEREAGIIEAARMSTQKSFEGWTQSGLPGDEKLLGYLYRNQHSTPFEFAGMTIEVHAPIFVVRQWHRHRTQSYNEASARYAPLPDVDFVPTIDRLTNTDSTNKQAASSKAIADADAASWLARVRQLNAQQEKLYQDGLAAGVPKEIARIVLSTARYTKMRSSANLRNWLGFLRLRLDPHAQIEIREYAEAVAEIVADQFPRTWALFGEES